MGLDTLPVPLGLTGATDPTRYVGGTVTGAPTTGTFAVGDFVVASDGVVWICTVAGTPGTWVSASGLSQAASDARYARLGAANVFTIAPQQITIDAAGNAGLIIKMAAAQTANAFNLLDSTGSSKAFVGASGTGRIGTSERIQIASSFGLASFTNVNEYVLKVLFPAASSSNNYFQMADAASGASPVLSAQGADTNASLTFQPKGTGGIVLGSGSTGITNHLSATATLDFGNILAAAAADLTVTVTGAAVGDSCYAAPSTTIESGVIWNAWVSAADTVTIRANNAGAVAVDPVSRSWRVDVWKH